MKIKIYLITNTAVIPHMYYVGLTGNELVNRLQEHVTLGRHQGNKLLSDAIIEYGKRNFTISVIEEVEDSEARLREDFYIRKYKSHYMDGCGYNMRYETFNYEKHYHGANRDEIIKNINNGRVWNYGIEFSQNSKDKISKTKKYRYLLGLYTKFNTNHSQETKDKISASKIGVKLKQETKDKISKQSSGRIWIHNVNFKKRKFIKECDINSYLLNGWVVGRGLVWMNNMAESVCINIWDHNKYNEMGFFYGRVIKC